MRPAKIFKILIATLTILYGIPPAMKNIARNLLVTFGVLGLVSPAHAVITYTITSGASGSLTASGNIFDGITNIGTWTSTLAADVVADAYTGTGAVTPIGLSLVTAGLATSNSAPQLGLFMRMTPYDTPSSSLTGGTQTYTITFSATVGAGYTVNSAFISGRVAPGPANFGPNILNGTTANLFPVLPFPAPAPVAATTPNTNVLTFSGFTGNAVLSDPLNNLVQADGALVANLGTLNWNQGPTSADGDSSALETNWYLTIPTSSGNTITYAADFGQGANGILTTAYNEAVGFGFDIIPEPSSTMLIGAGVLGLLVRRRRSN